MTVVEASSLLFEWYRDHDHICLEEDCEELFADVDNVSEHYHAAVISSLTDMCSHEIVSCCVVGEKTYYVLKKPLASYDQSLEIDYPTANLIASTLNSLSGRLDGFAENADPMSLKVKDLRNLAGLISAIMPDDEGEDDIIV